MRPLRFLAALFALAAAGCSIMPDEADPSSSDSDVVGSCSSPLAERVAAAADSGKKPMDARLTSTANRVVGGPFAGGAAISDEITRIIGEAKQEVMLEFFDIEVDSWMAGRLRDAIQRLPANVKVYVLVNPDQGQRFFHRLAEKPKTRVENMNDLFGNDPRVKVAAWNGARWLKQLDVLHTKQVIVDGKTVFMTDTNLQGNSDPQEHGGHGWYQLGVTLEGAVAQSLRAEMIEAFGHSTPSLDIEAIPAAPVSGCTPMTVLARGAGAGEDASANLGYAAMFRAATKNVNVITPNLNDDHALDALAAATERAEVNIILSKGFNDFNENIPGQGGTNEENVGRLAKLAKNACNLHMRWFARTNHKAVDGNIDGANHAKWASADGVGMVAGSQNLDTQSWKKSRELNVFIDDRITTERFDAEFAKQWSNAEVAYEKGCAAK